MGLTGAPKIVGEVVDYSAISSGRLKGITILAGVVERGEKPKFLQSDLDFRKEFGGELADDDFPYLVLRFLKRKGKCWVIPINHYTDVDDPSTIVGVKAVSNLTVATDEVDYEATSIGPWANGNLTVTTSLAASGLVNAVDVKVELAGYPELTKVVIDVDDTPTADELLALNRQLKLVQMTGFTTKIPVGVASFTTGARVYGDIVPVDYIGSAIGKTGIYAANDIRDAVRIAVPDMADGDIDYALSQYVDSRKDMLAGVRTPLSLDGDTILEYRNGTGSYTHTPVNSWRTFMYTGGLKTNDFNGDEKSHSEIADILANMSRRDNTNEPWFSASGANRGIIEDAIGPVQDFSSPGLSTDYDRIYVQGVNAVTQEYDEELGNITVIGGNRTLYKPNKLTQKLNIAEYLVWLYRAVMPKVRKWSQYEPNDPIMWRGLFLEIEPILKKSADLRAIRPDFLYIGDQQFSDYRDAKFNSTDDLDAGKYKFKVLVKPIGATEYVGFEIGVTNSGVNLEEII